MKLIFILAITLVLSACAGITPKPAEPSQPGVTIETRWEEHQQRMQAITRWTLNGRAAVSSGNKGGSVTVNWVQQHHNYHIELYGLLGQGRTELIANGSQVRLINAKGQWASQDAETLLGKYTGWYLPVDNLYYWVRGIPTPRAIDSIKLNAEGHLAYLKQDAWIITYHEYMYINGLWLPQRITLKYPGNGVQPALSVKWLSKNWQGVSLNN